MKRIIPIIAAAFLAACGPKPDKIIALSFDDGPSNVTDDILDILKKEKVKASFFVVGSWAKTDEYDYSQSMVKAFKQGHAIENHTWDHPYMTRLTKEQMTDEIERNADWIESLIGERPEFFRPPYIALNRTMFDTIELPFICGEGCNDWEDNVTTDERANKMVASARDGMIFLLHDFVGNEKTVEAVDRVIPILKQKGFTFVTVRELFKAKNVAPQKNIIYTDILNASEWSEK